MSTLREEAFLFSRFLEPLPYFQSGNSAHVPWWREELSCGPVTGSPLAQLLTSP